jgi:hypothetical protein
MLKVENSYFYSDLELELIKKTFAENEPLLKLLRKVFVPQYHETASDIGGITNDMHNHPDFDVKSYPSVEQAFVGMQARMQLVQLVENSLWKLKMLAGEEKETVEQMKARLNKDSAK